MEISLVRHGKSQWSDNKLITSREFKNWVQNYDNSGVFEEKSYPLETLEKIAAAKLVMTSDLTRSVESAKLLNSNIQMISNPLFRETELPIPFRKLGRLKVKASTWAIVLRCLWFSGYSNGCESLTEAKKRAEQAAILLVKCAKEYENVVLVGHGFFNMLIAKELKKLGWTGARRTSSKHWAATTYLLKKKVL
ncbi:phosphoglycerate mutase family protein [Bacillus sp. FJAT-49711]|uniref:histidine phosphatase family protein n=1 Tax=Bacillus sp. FJAT-49711 TaxID=2833585 RepID=UPI001BCA3807|nr:phosphoglycerate mutase family protein [Bacillus sp. FJAT-49711]MBS4218252.1 phosphoglycerate mutase family protein [Bacillus sp. FJAT-49711]